MSDTYNFDFNNYPSNEEIANNVKAKLKHLRMQREFSQGDISELIDKSRSTIQAWERANKATGPIIKPDYRDLSILADVYNVSLDDLFGRNSYMPQPKVGYILPKEKLRFFDGRPVQFESHGKFIWGIVNSQTEKIITKDGGFDFKDLPDDFEASLIPNNIFQRDELFDAPYTISQIMELAKSDKVIKVWVNALNDEYNITEAYYVLAPGGVKLTSNTVLSYQDYNISWVAYPNKPVFAN